MKAVLLSVLVILGSTLLGGLTAHYYFSSLDKQTILDNKTVTASKEDNITLSIPSSTQTFKIYYPDNSTLVSAEISVELDSAFALRPVEIALNELAKRLSSQHRTIKFHNLYKDADNIIYVDVSDITSQTVLNALEEYLIVQSIARTVLANANFALATKILIDGKEAETLAGHISIMHPIKLTDAASQL